MAAREYLRNAREADDRHSTEDIWRDIVKKEENISRTAEQIGERITEKRDWRGYVKDSPYLALGVAAGLGYLASGMLLRRSTLMERNTGSINEADGDSLDEVRAGAAGPSLLKVTLLGIAAKAVVDWIKDAISTDVVSSSIVPRPLQDVDQSLAPERTGKNYRNKSNVQSFSGG
jgi:ElaB/YqjD/DUF883 family membrane-anchored ribosome-binding protein